MAGFAFEDPIYQPALRLVTNITNAFPAVVTTSFDHDYVDDLVIRLWVPQGYGMVQVDQQFARIKVLSPTTFSIDLDTTTYDTFIYPSASERQALPRTAQCTPTGSFNNTTLGVTRNVLPFV